MPAKPKEPEVHQSFADVPLDKPKKDGDDRKVEKRPEK